MSQGFRCQRYHLADGVALVAAAGEIDLETAPVVQTVLLAALAPETPDVVIDLTQVTMLDSTGLAALVSCWHRAEEFGGTVQVVGASANVRAVFELTKLDQLVTQHPSVSAAVEAITNRPAGAEQNGHGAHVFGAIQALGDPAAS